MSPEKEKYLKDKFPQIFEENFYFECDDGWFDLLDSLCEDIQSYINHKSRHLSSEDLEIIQPKATQVKEKYGTLRFYHYGSDEYIDGMVSFAETCSARICQACGAKAKLYKNAWHRTHCEPCELDYQKQRASRS